MSVIIAAIPRQDDHVWKISSEKVPHLTMLFLGEVEDGPTLARISQFLEHAASTSLPRFGLSVDKRGVLGDESADVLFFEKQYMQDLFEFRSALLQNDDISKAYNMAEQYPSWTPHLTLGYPETPAKPDYREYPISYVQFDRIALWVGDYEGPTFDLKSDERMAVDVAMSDLNKATDFLAHYGVKGMKWGVRKAEKAQRQADRLQTAANKQKERADRKTDKRMLGAGGEQRKARRMQEAADRQKRIADRRWDKVDKKWEKSIYTTSGAVAVHNAMADHFNSRIGAINDRHPDANLIKNPDSEASKAYMNEVTKLEMASYSHAVTQVHGSSPSRKKEAIFIDDENGSRIEVRDVDVEHAEGDMEPNLVFMVRLNDSGRIVELNQAEEAAEHCAFNSTSDFLAHYGVKGMKWGVRKDRSPTAVEVSQKKPGTFVKTKGGENHPASEDALRAATTRQKARKSTTDALSNRELQDLVQRMNLEQQYNQLAFQSDRRSKGSRFIAGLLGNKRYTGEKRKYFDEYEKRGESIREVIEQVGKNNAA